MRPEIPVSNKRLPLSLPKCVLKESQIPNPSFITYSTQPTTSSLNYNLPSLPIFFRTTNQFFNLPIKQSLKTIRINLINV
ncbi:hypothetical protein EYC80_004685 [Monilinia laxa]|uniref:Uncharacterized protein n=1 Tax=Monilinia laxa TaxID=61186 RepID=A0A5N6KHV3_MONLA|nr:hypothetical protein EYC80_004685 [Monilinia laxa]